MALNNRLIQNIDLQGDATDLQKALGSIGLKLNEIVKSSGTLNANLAKGASAGTSDFNKMLKTVQQLVAQASILQSVLDGTTGRKTIRAKGLLDEQKLGKQTSAAAKLTSELKSTDTAAAALERRLSLLRTKFAELGDAGRRPNKTDLAKELKIEDALKQVNQLQGAITRLNGKSLNTPTRGNSTDMQNLRREIEKVNAELLKSAQNSRKSNFQPHIDQVRALTDQYQRLIAAEIRQANISSGRTSAANNRAQQILAQTDSQRLAQVQRAAASFQFPQGISNTVSTRAAEDQLAASMRRRLDIMRLIEAAQTRGASTRAIERLNSSYDITNKKLGEQFKLLAQVNAEQAKTPGTQAFKDRASGARAAIKEQLFGDGGVGFATRIGGAALISTGVFAAINGFQQATKTVIEYEDALKQLQAISGSTDGQLQNLSKSILDVAENSKYSVIEITKAATVIAQAGFSSGETQSLLKGVVTLSSAAGVDPSQASDVLTGAIGAFNLEANETPRIVDTLVTGLNRTKLSVDQVQQAIQYAGATAKESGATFSELIAVAATAANSGIRSGSTIGTGYRQLIVDLQTPTKDFKQSLDDLGLSMSDVNVRSLGFAAVVKNLTDAGFSAEQAYDSFETRAASFFLSFRNQVDTYDELALALAEGGSAAAAQEKAMDSLTAQWARFKNILTGFTTGVGSILTDSLKVLLSVLNEVLLGVGAFIKGIMGFAEALGFTGAQVGVLGAALIGSLFGPIGTVVGAFIGLTAAMGGAGSEMSKLEDQLAETNATYDENAQTISSVDDAINRLIERQSSLTDGSTELQVETVNLSGQFEGLNVALDSAKVGYGDLLSAMVEYGQQARETALTTAQLAAAQGTALADTQVAEVNGKTLPSYLDRGAGIRYLDKSSRANVDAVKKIIAIPVNKDNAGVAANGARSVLADLIKNKANPGLITFLQEHLAELATLASTVRQVSLAEARESALEATLTDQYIKGNDRLNSVRSQVESTVSASKDGDSVGVGSLLKNIDVEIKQLEANRAKFGEATAEYRGYSKLINDYLAQKSKLKTQVRHVAEEDKKAASEAQKVVARTGTPKKDIDELASLARAEGFSVDYGRGRTDSAKHSAGLAIDINIPGAGNEAANARYKSRFDQKALEYQKLGYNVIWNKKVYWADGRVTGIPAEWKTNDHSNHLHANAPAGGITIGEGGATQSAGSKADELLFAQEEKLEKNKLAQGTRTASARIQAVIAQGKAGTATAKDLQDRLGLASSEYQSARLAEFDNGYDIATLSGPALEDYQLSRAALMEEIIEKAKTDIANLARSISDAAEKVYDLAIQAIQTNLDEAEYNADGVVRDVDSRISNANNSMNRGRNADSGTQYYLNQQREAALLNSDRAKVSLQDNANANTSLVLGDFKAEIDAMPNGEAKTAAVMKYNDAFKALNESLARTEQLQESINGRTQEYIALPLNERIKNGVTAWADQSGAMDTWQDTIANNVGPALELITNQFADLFAKLATGQTTLKSALASMVQAIGQFVVQLIAKALALMAIKWFLSLIGLQLETGPGGTTIGSIPKQMTGGPAGEPMKLMNGGYISQGVSNRDSVPALLAQNEYVVRGESVSSIGREAMDQINRHGSKALDKMSGSPVIAPQAKQEVNVFVVKPNEKPQMTQNDIIVAITDDMLQGGATKQLVRKISQGG